MPETEDFIGPSAALPPLKPPSAARVSPQKTPAKGASVPPTAKGPAVTLAEAKVEGLSSQVVVIPETEDLEVPTQVTQEFQIFLA